jgi:hypothetical protein
MITPLPTPIEMETPLGFGWCRFTWEWPHTVFWGVVQADTNEIWWWQNHHVRMAANISEGRPNVTPIKVGAPLEKALEPHRSRYPERKPQS